MLGEIIAVTQLIGGGLQVYGGLEEAEANKKAGRYNAAILRERAADVDAIIKDVGVVGAQQMVDLIGQRNKQMGAGRAGFAAGNVVVAHGSASRWEIGLKGMTAQDANRLRANIGKSVEQLRSQQRSLEQHAVFEEWRGETGATAAYIGTVGTALGAATNFAATINRANGG